MIVDTSALVAILKNEPESQALLDALRDSPTQTWMSAATYVELFLVVDNAGDPAASGRVEQLIAALRISVADVTPRQAELARTAHRSFGRGNHPAGLNFGDCFSYALARDRNEPLLYTGDDFRKTDVRCDLPGEP